jgi:N-acetylated-alpha-linked acidic dipeptidase
MSLLAPSRSTGPIVSAHIELTMRRTLSSLLAIVVLAGSVAAGGAGRSILGFAPASAEAQRKIEAAFLKLPSQDRVREDHRFLTEEPHVAGSPRNRLLAEWQRDRWQAWGLEDVHVVTHEVLLPWPEEVRVEMVAPRAWQATLKEDVVDGDPSTLKDAGITYLAYSGSGDVTGEVVYAGSGNPENYDWLAAQGIDLRGKIALVRYSLPYSYRGFKALTAEQRGLAGMLIYSDPAEDGYKKGKTYPDGPWGPESHIQRGGIPFDFLVPGDPLTPGWASIPGAKRIPLGEAVSIPKIISVPLSYREARVILEALGGPEAPAAWQGALPITYHAGAGPARVRLKVAIDTRTREIQTVIGRIRGAEFPDEEVIVGNHRDAWVFGGVDPSSGSATLMDLARSLGTMVKRGVRPKRTIVFASWDAEEFTLTSSTEWGEQYADDLRRRAVAYINVDSSASGPNFTSSAVPSLNQFIAEAARDVAVPGARQSIAAVAAARTSRESGALPNAAAGELTNNRLGSGSDYTVFLNFLGVPVIDMAFDGPYGVYHSIYDNHQWVSRIGDPGFRYHTGMTRLWGVMALRLANADVLPLDYRPYAARLAEFAKEVEGRVKQAGATGPSPFTPVHAAIERFRSAAAAAASRSEAAVSGTTGERAAVNRALMDAERALLDPEGIPGRPWYRHQVYAPKFTYAPEVLPGPAEAIAAGDAARLARECQRLAAAIDRAAGVLSR